jgi:hypothetical protein
VADEGVLNTVHKNQKKSVIGFSTYSIFGQLKQTKPATGRNFKQMPGKGIAKAEGKLR